MLVVVLSFDAFGTRFVGPYGDEPSLTPGLDHLAAASLVFGNARADTVGTHSVRSLLSGRHFWPGNAEADIWSTWDLFAEAGIDVQLLVEAPDGQLPEDLPDAAKVTAIDGQDGSDADDFETPFAQLIAEANRRIRDHAIGDQRLIWLKSRGVPSPWIPPSGFLDLSEDDDGPEGYEDSDFSEVELEAVPEESIEAPANEDEIVDDRAIDLYQDWVFSAGHLGAAESIELDDDDWEISLAGYTGYLRLIDQFTMELVAALAEVEDRVLLILAGAEGRELDERRDFDVPEFDLSASRLNVPLMLLSPALCEPGHWPGLVSVVDVLATVSHVFGLGPTGDGRSLLPEDPSGLPDNHELLYYASGDERAVETDSHRVVFLPEKADRLGRPLLFLKPDDFWDCLDVSKQESEQVEFLLGKLNEWENRRGDSKADNSTSGGAVATGSTENHTDPGD